MDRRDFIRLLTSSILAAPLSALKSHLSFASADLDGLIDAHCHVFNAHDLPISGFIKTIVIPNEPRLQNLPTTVRDVFLFYIDELTVWANNNSITADDEIKLLKDISAKKARIFKTQEIADREVKFLGIFFDRLISIARGEDKKATASLKARSYGKYVPVAIVGLIHQEAYPEQFYAPVQGINMGKPKHRHADNFYDPKTVWRDGKNLAEGLYYQQESTTARYARWMMQFTRYRHELVQDLSRIHNGRAALITPALIDYTHWLNDKNQVNLDGQVRSMGAVSRFYGSQSKGVRVHPYAPFDPLRQVLFENNKEVGSPLERVKTAINSEGFIGVKLYPPMGFRALDNTKITDSDFFPSSRQSELGIKNIGKSLDSALRQLYGWCSDNQVPILVHAAHSNGTSPLVEDRAAPQFWGLVVEEFPNIRLCLAHFGDFEQGLVPKSKLSDTWEWQIAKMISSKPERNIYADISYLHSALIDTNDDDVVPRTEAQRMFGNTLQEFGEGLKKKLVYGTDWSMLGVEPKFRANGSTYDNKAWDFLMGIKISPLGDTTSLPKTLSNSEMQDIFKNNAALFLGLGTDQRDRGTRGRLERFYKDNNLQSAWLDRY